ncbi:hypothetical protein Halar_2222 [halophilic archaeon DL31]|nr:hypothetical protein Halar_2222 [halophilic archaeon DL31]
MFSKLGDIPITFHRDFPDVHKSDSSCAAHQKSEISEDDADMNSESAWRHPSLYPIPVPHTYPLFNSSGENSQLSTVVRA